MSHLPVNILYHGFTKTVDMSTNDKDAENVRSCYSHIMEQPYIPTINVTLRSTEES